MNTADIHAWLAENDWKPGYKPEYESYDRIWYKRYRDVKPNCYCNDDKPGLQVSLKEYDHTRYPNVDRVGYEVGLCAEPDDGIWIHFQCYTLTSDNLQRELESQVRKLIRAWKACQTGVRDTTISLN